MFVLGIETSCDETSVAVVRDGKTVLSNIIASQVKLHQKTGGVVPEVAAREHVEHIMPCVDAALAESGVTMEAIDAIAVTRGPGLIGCLLTGVSAARTLAWLLNKQLIGVNHIAGHIYANWLGEDRDIQFPVVVLTASGGHNELVLMRDHCTFELLGETLDDAAGEAFDKVARIIGLGYPGGPAIQRAAEQGKPDAYRFPRAWLQDPSTPLGMTPKEITNFNFSFSGLKTAVLREVESVDSLSGKQQADIAASFQEAVVDVLASKATAAAKKFGAQELHLAGGVSANSALRERCASLLDGSLTFRFPEKIAYCTDNAAMIAAAGYYELQRGTPTTPPSLRSATPHFDSAQCRLSAGGDRFSWRDLEATPVLPLTK